MTTTTIRRTNITVEEFARRAAMAHARKLGAAKGRATQAATRAVAKAKADVKARAPVAVEEIDADITNLRGRIARARPAANNPRGGRWARQASDEITKCLSIIKRLRNERAHFVAQL